MPFPEPTERLLRSVLRQVAGYPRLERERESLVPWLRHGLALAAVLAAAVYLMNVGSLGSTWDEDLATWNTIANLTWLP